MEQVRVFRDKNHPVGAVLIIPQDHQVLRDHQGHQEAGEADHRFTEDRPALPRDIGIHRGRKRV
jgi:hypothetical protein